MYVLEQRLRQQQTMGILDFVFQYSSSDSLLMALVVLLLVYLVSSSSVRSSTDGNEPPGPKKLPLLGNLLQLDLKKPYQSLLKLSKTYGPVFTVYLGPQKVVVLAGYRTVKEALVTCADDFGERDPLFIADEYSHGNGVLWSNGDSWKEMRRFALTNLRDFGMGKKACEDKIIEECDQLVKVFQGFKGAAFDTTQPVNYAVSNIICSIVYGSRFEYDDAEFTALVDRTSRNTRLLGSLSIQVYHLYPWIFKWLPNRREFFRLVKANKQHNLELLRRLKKTLDPQMCRGLVDAFLVRQQMTKQSGSKSFFHEENLINTVLHLFAAGIDTTATTLRWGLLFMAKYPNIQDQVQEELSKVIGSRQVQMEDRKHLPFTNAVIHEIQRVAIIIPMSLPHRTSRDVTFHGHFIKKGTTVYPLLASVLYDETEWKKPCSFYPAHFLDRNGNFVKRDAFMPFAAGHRMCLGESLAKMELFIFFTTLLQHFRFSPAPGVSQDDLDLTPHGSFILNPTPHKLSAVFLL